MNRRWGSRRINKCGEYYPGLGTEKQARYKEQASKARPGGTGKRGLGPVLQYCSETTVHRRLQETHRSERWTTQGNNKRPTRGAMIGSTGECTEQVARCSREMRCVRMLCCKGVLKRHSSTL